MRIEQIIAQLRADREQHGQRVRDVARALGVSDATLTRWETGDDDPASRKLAQWARLSGYELRLERRLPEAR